MSLRAVKETIRVVLLTNTHRLEGDVHVVPGGRLLDEINKERDFLPLTKADIYDLNSSTLIDSLQFIAINKSQIVMIAPAGR